MEVDLKSAANLLLFNKRILSINGMWPLDRTFVHFYISYVYLVVHLILAYYDLISVYGNIHLMMGNLLETSVQTMFCFKMIVVRHSRSLKQILRRVEEGTHDRNYRDNTEKQLYLAHNVVGQTFFKAGHYLTFATGVIYYLGPLKDFLTAAVTNDTLPYILPYKTHLFIDIQNIRNYALMYIWQLPLVYYGYCHGITVCFLCTLVFHVTGKMSVLAHRIRLSGSTSDSSIENHNSNAMFRDIVDKHLDVIWEASAIDDVFSLLLLEELFISTVLVALSTYILLSPAVPVYEKLFLGNYCSAIVGIILIYCLTGDSLIRESENIRNAFYECEWYKMQSHHQKNLIICMVRSQQPAQLTAGRFYIFSLPRFSEILKTAMAYISMLRTDDIKQAKSLFELNKRVFAIIGVWPLQPTYGRFSVWCTYVAIHLSLLFADLYYAFGDLEAVVLNVTETGYCTMSLSKMIILRFSGSLVGLMKRIIADVDVNYFRSSEELKLYLSYNRIAKKSFKFWLTMGIISCVSYNLKCLEFRVRSAFGNETLPYILPNRTWLFFDVTKASTFWLVWLYQCPIVCTATFQVATIGYVFSLILHVCGKLSVLVFRIKQLDLSSVETDEHTRKVFRDIVQSHLDILDMAENINRVFGFLLLEELLVCTVLIGLSSYSVLRNTDLEEIGAFFTFLSYVLTILAFIYGYCIAGEYLITESKNLYEAYYQCQWYKMPKSVQKQLIICIIGATKPIQLNAGGFYVFSLPVFVSILKTSAGYISMLREMI
ncbi:uncharacterized protein [Venturia canescens]|uniref:uncharacterized protein n=1 Tax=Venturia canescens TaxID=32260 RepID=UPI001C9C9BDD|nr:uncharacterized protein LOC122412324 [Venturia canescens]